MPLLICRTCPRYDLPASGTFRHELDDVFARDGAVEPGAVRHVLCLGGCPEDGVAALDAPGKARVRFTKLTGADAPALAAATRDYDASDTGAPDDWDVPAELRDRISTVTTKRQARTCQ
ncbi:hypothetical protein AAFP30_23350 [Gordonia sp. CPCC 205515]|uniref:hypothetical protein n=1 Tax=Gordonia sp. CPCC 205515 TaxID=3140791 RepID=UPI003AF3EE61